MRGCMAVWRGTSALVFAPVMVESSEWRRAAEKVRQTHKQSSSEVYLSSIFSLLLPWRQTVLLFAVSALNGEESSLFFTDFVPEFNSCFAQIILSQTRY